MAKEGGGGREREERAFLSRAGGFLVWQRPPVERQTPLDKLQLRPAAAARSLAGWATGGQGSRS